MKLSQIEKIIFNYENILRENDFSFLKRIYKDGIDKYLQRLVRYGFKGYNSVLDAGCGFGQWTIALSSLNNNVAGIEYSSQRVEFIKDAICELGIDNINIMEGSIEELPYSDCQFDAVFCYGVIFLTDWKKSLNELSRVLKPGGKLYVNANDIGWYIFLWETEHNKTSDYDPRFVVAKAFHNTWAYNNNQSIEKGRDIIIKPVEMKKELTDLEFHSILIEDEGCYKDCSDNVATEPFFLGQYKTERCVYEVAAIKE